jgi:cell division protein FtsQ
VLNFLKKIGSFFRLRSNKNKRAVRSGTVAPRGNQPAFTSRSAVHAQKRKGLVSRIRAWFQRVARRKELKQSPVVAKNRLKGLVVPFCLLVFIVSIAFVAYGPLVNAVSGMPVFKIREITITGCRKTSPSLIRELAGVRYQTSMLTLRPTYIEAILKAHPWISEAVVKRDWPGGALVISIKEYVAEALIAQEISGRKQLFYLDKSGVAFAPVEPGQDMDFPVITGLDAKGDDGQGRPNAAGARDTGQGRPSVTGAKDGAGVTGGSGDGQGRPNAAGENNSGDAERKTMIRESLALLKLVKQNNPNLPVQNLSEIHLDQDTGMTIYLVDYPFPIYFGKGEIRTKYSRLKRVLEVLYKDTEQGMTIADVVYIRMDYLENKVLVAHSGSG